MGRHVWLGRLQLFCTFVAVAVVADSHFAWHCARSPLLKTSVTRPVSFSDKHGLAVADAPCSAQILPAMLQRSAKAARAEQRHGQAPMPKDATFS